MSGDRLTALEASFLWFERPGRPIHVGAVATFEGGPLLNQQGHLRLEEVRKHLTERVGKRHGCGNASWPRRSASTVPTGSMTGISTSPTNLVVTNVPGPPIPLYLLGAEMLEAIPVVPLGANLTVGVAILSYSGALNIGLTADADACPDVDVLAQGIERGLAEVCEICAR